MKKIMITLALACGIFTAASAAKNEKPSGTLYVDSKGVVRKKIEEE